MPANERFPRRGCFVGIRSARCCAHCLRKTRSIRNGSSRTALNGPEVNQTKPEHHLTVRSVQIARGTRLRLSPSLRCHVEHPLEHKLTAETFVSSNTNANGQGNGGARRDRTDDLKLAKLPLSQLSYGPNSGHLLGSKSNRRSNLPTHQAPERQP